MGSVTGKRGILMRDELVCQTLAGLKTETRRVIKPRSAVGRAVFEALKNGSPLAERELLRNHSRYGKSGDLLWVREAWRPDVIEGSAGEVSCIRYRAGDGIVQIKPTFHAANKWLSARRPEEQYPELRSPKWRPGIHMFEWAARLWLLLERVSLERVGDITPEGARAEGFETIDDFCETWDDINGGNPLYAIAGNPWVWVLEYSVLPQSKRAMLGVLSAV